MGCCSSNNQSEKTITKGETDSADKKNSLAVGILALGLIAILVLGVVLF